MDNLRRALRAAFVVAGALLIVPPVATAGQRYTTPTASSTGGACSSAAPCRIDAAINAAAAGDEVIVAPGTYTVSAALSPTVPVDIHGVAGQARPVLIGSGSAALLSTKKGGTLRHLELRATGADQDALTLQGVLAEDLLLLSSSGGDGAKIVGAKPATVLRDTLVRTVSPGASALKLREGGSAGDVALRNVTAIGGDTAIRCEIILGQATLVNVIARGMLSDVDASRSARCEASYSALRPALSPGLALGAGIQASDPRFVDTATNNYHELGDSPTVDAGTADALLGSADLDGRSRIFGSAPDIGAFEYPGFAVFDPPSTPPPTPAQTLPPDLRGVPLPVVGETIIVAPGTTGRVLVRRPAARRFRRVRSATRVPVGSVVDARHGRMRLVSAITQDGHVQTGRFWGARFAVGQNRADGMTLLRLRGGDFGACPQKAGASRVATDQGRARRTVRSLWARDRNGRFRTYGNNSVATARGTAWVTRDRCDGTLTTVTEGAVAVRDRAAGRTVVVRAGHRYLARGR